MARPPVSKAKLGAALAAVAAGSSLADAASANGIGLSSLKRYRAAQKGPAPTPPERQPAAPVPAPEDPVAVAAGDESLIDTLALELRYARHQRRVSVNDSATRAWSKRIEELVKVIERIAPPPPPPPDQLIAALRELDGEFVRRVEMHLPDRIDPAEAWPKEGAA